MTVALALLALVAQSELKPVPDAPKGFRLELCPLPLDVPPSPMRWNYRLRFVNGGTVPVTVRDTGFWEDYRVILRDANGDEPPRTALGDRLLNAIVHRYGDRNHDFARVVAPEGTFETGARFTIGDMFVLPSGRYTLSVEYYEQLGNKMRVRSNTITVKYTASPDEKP